MIQIPTLSENKCVTVEPIRLPSNCNVYIIHQTQGAEGDEEALQIAAVMGKALNQLLKDVREGLVTPR